MTSAEDPDHPAQTAEVTFWHRVAGQIARAAPGDDRYETGVLATPMRC